MQRRGKPSLELRTPGDKDSPEKPRQIVPVGEHHEGSAKLYMSHKMLKLQEQSASAVSAKAGGSGEAGPAEAAAAAAGSPPLEPFFAGVIIYVNGYSEPPLQVRHRLCKALVRNYPFVTSLAHAHSL